MPTSCPPNAIEPGVTVTSGPLPARNSSAVDSGWPSGPSPPAMSTRPLGSSVAVWWVRVVLIAPGDTQMPGPGS